ncbi:dynein regulatory complex protein 11-like [Macrosteles quadrilineatus]|uniref:dynein regulatory complex protein 11-like n=1 Tax=Macrosteles quadrilineatus TaxID=74068 RepID=UPI0023E1E7BB|nr:dynein regulatory complex protein 11-like [Macrosteles quadrilineatus]
MYETHWREVEGELADILRDDKEYVAQDVIEDRPKAFKQAATNYIRYTRCANKLNICLDQMVHANKRITVRTLLEATISRMLQVKQELVNQELSDFNYLDGVLADMRLTPYDVECQVPRYYRRERAEKIAKINNDIDAILEELGTVFSNYTDYYGPKYIPG